MKDLSNKKKWIVNSVIIVVTLIVLLGVSYALFQVTLYGTKKTKLDVGTLSLKLTDKYGLEEEEGFGIDLEETYPMYDSEGLQTEEYEFHIVNDGTINAEYRIYLDDEDISANQKLDPSNIRYAIKVNDNTAEMGTLSEKGESPNRVIGTGKVYKDQTDVVKLWLWLDIEAGNETQGKSYSGKIRIEGMQSSSIFPTGTIADIVSTPYKDQIKRLHSPIRNGFDSTTETSGLYEYTDEDGTSTYSFRGTNISNYVTFANSSWRIVSISMDGTIKLIKEEGVMDYVGYASNQWNGDYETVSGCQYQGSNEQNYLNAWYNVNISDYDEKVETVVYCNDFYQDENSQAKTELYSSWSPLLGVYNRVTFTDKDDNSTYQWKPNISCEKGVKINAKIALLTADEYIIAGGGRGATNNYLKKSYRWWTISPMGYSERAKIYIVSSNGGLGNLSSMPFNQDQSNRPVITLKANNTISSGEGTLAKPYVIE